jgi:hypothetical protein
LYHRLDDCFPLGPPLLDVWIPAAKIAGITLGPAMLGQGFSGFPTGLVPAGLLSGADPGIRPEIAPAELAMDEHRRPPPKKAMEAIVTPRRKRKFKPPPPSRKNLHPLRLHHGRIRYPYDCRLQTASVKS